MEEELGVEIAGEVQMIKQMLSSIAGGILEGRFGSSVLYSLQDEGGV
jgi:hypothetical protein